MIMTKTRNLYSNFIFVLLGLFLSIVLFFVVSRANKPNTASERESGNFTAASSDIAIFRTRVTSGLDDAEEKGHGGVNLDSSDLELTYDNNNQQVGIRFTGVNIPKKAKIKNAYIEFTVDETSTEETNLIIKSQDADNSTPFISTKNNISLRPKTKTSVSWSPSPWTGQGQSKRTPDLAPIVQEIVNKPSWDSDNTMVFIITGTGKRVAESYDGEPTKAPLLYVEYISGTGNSTPNITSFSVTPNKAKTKEIVTYSWSVSDTDGDALNCSLDVNDDGNYDFNFSDCTSTASKEYEYTSTGNYTAKLKVIDTNNNFTTATTTITIGTISNSSSTSVTIAAAGDIACDPDSSRFNDGNGTKDSCHMKAVAEVIETVNPVAVLSLGDLQYEDGKLWKFQESYDPSWGRFKSITYPAVGNHEYLTSGAKGYFDYFGSRAGDSSKGYYSYDKGEWHLIALNSNCGKLGRGGCSADGDQEQWLRNDLANNSSKCILAYAHHPRFSSGIHGNNSNLEDLWKALYEYNADLFLSGHDHNYERFAPQTPSGQLDNSRGIRQLVVGTGGKSVRSLKDTKPNSELRDNNHHGALKLTLHPQSYDWEFISDTGTIIDSGSDNCH